MPEPVPAEAIQAAAEVIDRAKGCGCDDPVGHLSMAYAVRGGNPGIEHITAALAAAAPAITAAERERLRPAIREAVKKLWLRAPFTSMTADRMNAEVDATVAGLIGDPDV